jgi:energy-coupling factor transporter ATP-binding protein EcfA2
MSEPTKICIHNSTSDFNSYRAARVKSLFNAENGCNFDLEAELDLSGEWQIGVVVGPSGSGKSSIGKVIFGEDLIHDYTKEWSKNSPIIDEIAPDGDFNEVTGALANVGLGDVPAWLRPFHVLSNGEQFRAGLARLICMKVDRVVVDEFTSVVDRQIARIGSQAFQKAWRRTNPKGKVVLLTPHYDILDWVQPDWVFDTKTKLFDRGRLRQRPRIKLEIFKTNSSYWPYFKQHYYLDLPMPPAAEYFVGTVDGELACHLAVSPLFTANGYRATRLVTMPEWQGAGVGFRFLEWVCQYHLEGNGRKGHQFPTFFHTSHPQLSAALRRSKRWVQTSAALYGANKSRSAASIMKSQKRNGTKSVVGLGYGGHFRAVQGFKYIGG